MASLVIRPIEGADVDAVRAVAASANEEFRAAMGEAFFRAYLANVLDVEARRRDATVLVAELGQTIVGTITVYRDVNDEGMPARFPQRTAGIRATAVAPTARGQGIGSRLVDAAIETGCAQGARAIALHTAECMNAATSLYQRHGFGRTPRYDYTANDFFGAREGRPLAALAFLRELGDCDPSAPPRHPGRPCGGRT
jgi:ribosomal protein S18 acetylase RimI-like enzyme